MGPEKEGRNLMVKKKQTDGKQTHALSEVLERYDRSQSYLSSIRLFLPSLITVRVHKQLVGWRMEKWRRERGHCDVRGGGGVEGGFKHFIMCLVGDSSLCLLVTKQHQCPESLQAPAEKHVILGDDFLPE